MIDAAWGIVFGVKIDHEHCGASTVFKVRKLEGFAASRGKFEVRNNLIQHKFFLAVDTLIVVKNAAYGKHIND